MGLSLRDRESLGKKLARRNRLVPAREIRAAPVQTRQSELSPSCSCLNEMLKTQPSSKDPSPPTSAHVFQTACGALVKQEHRMSVLSLS